MKLRQKTILKSDALPEVSHSSEPDSLNGGSGFFIPYRYFYVDSPFHESVTIHEKDAFKILVHRVKFKKKWTRKTLVKIETRIKNGRGIYTFRGFNMDDLLIIKRNWSEILKAMTL